MYFLTDLSGRISLLIDKINKNEIKLISFVLINFPIDFTVWNKFQLIIKCAKKASQIKYYCHFNYIPNIQLYLIYI